MTDPQGYGLAGVVIGVSPGYTQAVTTTHSGRFTVTALPVGTYVVSPERSRCAFQPVSHTVTVGEDVGGVNFLGRCTYATYLPTVLKQEPAMTHLRVDRPYETGVIRAIRLTGSAGLTVVRAYRRKRATTIALSSRRANTVPCVETTNCGRKEFCEDIRGRCAVFCHHMYTLGHATEGS